MKQVLPIGMLLLGLACRTAGPLPEAKPATKPSVDIVQAQLEAYNAQDLDAFLQAYSDDVVVVAGGKVIVEGKQALRDRYASLFAKYPRNRAKVAERRTEGDGVVLDHEIVTGRAPDKPDPWDVGWIRYEVENGRIRRVQLP